jgi:hypothetical protein
MCLIYTTIWKRAASAPPNQSALAWITTLAHTSVGP